MICHPSSSVFLAHDLDSPDRTDSPSDSVTRSRADLAAPMEGQISCNGPARGELSTGSHHLGRAPLATPDWGRGDISGPKALILEPGALRAFTDAHHSTACSFIRDVLRHTVTTMSSTRPRRMACGLSSGPRRIRTRPVHTLR